MEMPVIRIYLSKLINPSQNVWKETQRSKNTQQHLHVLENFLEVSIFSYTMKKEQELVKLRKGQEEVTSRLMIEKIKKCG